MKNASSPTSHGQTRPQADPVLRYRSPVPQAPARRRGLPRLPGRGQLGLPLAAAAETGPAMSGQPAPPPRTIHLDPDSAAARKLAERRARLAAQRQRSVSWQDTIEQLCDIAEAVGQ